MKKNGISSFAIVKSIKRGPSFHQQPQRWDNTSPITLFYFHVYLKYNKTKSVFVLNVKKSASTWAPPMTSPTCLFSSILHQNFIIIFLHLKSRRYTTIVVGMQNRINTPRTPPPLTSSAKRLLTMCGWCGVVAIVVVAPVDCVHFVTILFIFNSFFFTSFLPFIQFFYCTSSQNESVYNNHTMNECENNEKMANRVVKSPPVEWMEEIARKMCKFATF